MTERPQVDLEFTRKAIEKRPKFERALKILAQRDRGRQDTSFRRMKRVLEEKKGSETWSFQEIGEFFDMLAEAGAGIIVGDRVNGTIATTGDRTPRFLWAVHLQSFACAVLGKKEPVRKRKDGTVIESEGLRLPSPPRKVIPKMEDLQAPGGAYGRSTAFTPVLAASRTAGLDPHVAKLFRDFLNELSPEALTPAANRKLSEILLLLAK